MSQAAFLHGPGIAHAWFVLLFTLPSTLTLDTTPRWNAATSLLIIAFRDSFRQNQTEFYAAASEAMVLEKNRIRADVQRYTAHLSQYEDCRRSYYGHERFENLVDQLFQENQFVVKTTATFNEIDATYKVLKGPFRSKLVLMLNILYTQREADLKQAQLAEQEAKVNAKKLAKQQAVRGQWTPEQEADYEEECKKRDEIRGSYNAFLAQNRNHRVRLAGVVLPP